MGPAKIIMELMNADYSRTITASLCPLSPIPTGVDPQLDTVLEADAVLFDIYGTLLISGTGDIGVAAQQRDALGMGALMSESGFPAILMDAESQVPKLLDKAIRSYHKRARKSGIGYPEVEIREIWRKVLNDLWQNGQLEDDPSEKSVDLMALRHELEVNPVWPMPGFPEIVQKLNAADYKLGIVSNAQFYTPLILEALSSLSLDEMGFLPELRAWSFELGMAKPSPLVFEGPLASLERMGIAPERVVYIGNDMLNDVAAAGQAGCRTILFAGDRRSLRLRQGDERAVFEPDAIITELAQLETIIVKGA